MLLLYIYIWLDIRSYLKSSYCGFFDHSGSLVYDAHENIHLQLKRTHLCSRLLQCRLNLAVISVLQRRESKIHFASCECGSLKSTYGNYLLPFSVYVLKIRCKTKCVTSQVYTIMRLRCRAVSMVGIPVSSSVRVKREVPCVFRFQQCTRIRTATDRCLPLVVQNRSGRRIRV